MSALLKIKTLGELKKSKYQSKSVKDEIRDNLISKLQTGNNGFDGIVGYDDTVLPDLQRALLSRHNILFLGLRGQAKTRIARGIADLLDDYIPVIEGTQLNEDPFNPISKSAKELVDKLGDDTPISWISNKERYVEKLATPDVSVADLIGDVDPIKAATLKLTYADEEVIHYGLVPRANRSLFVINELPDLQPRIQVSLFNILQEGDVQIRGFKLRLPLDILFVFTANPEDYTNRGSIITPLKDRIDSQILTHYPTTIEHAMNITKQEVNLTDAQQKSAHVINIHEELLELIVFAARESEYIDEKSGVSARMSISAYENLVSTIERRNILNKEKKSSSRISDFWGVIPAITGKAELLYEGEQIGPHYVSLSLLEDAVESLFDEYFPDPETRDISNNDPYGTLRIWFNDDNVLQLANDDQTKDYHKKLDAVPGLLKLVQQFTDEGDDVHAFMELALHGLAAKEFIAKDVFNKIISFKDPLSNMLNEI